MSIRQKEPFSRSDNPATISHTYPSKLFVHTQTYTHTNTSILGRLNATLLPLFYQRFGPQNSLFFALAALFCKTYAKNAPYTHQPIHRLLLSFHRQNCIHSSGRLCIVESRSDVRMRRMLLNSSHESVLCCDHSRSLQAQIWRSGGCRIFAGS